MWKLVILHRNQKGFLSKPVYMRLKDIFAYIRKKKGTLHDWRKPATQKEFFIHSKPVQRMNNEIHYTTNKGKTVKNEWENDDSDFLWVLYSVNKKTHGNPFSILTC